MNAFAVLLSFALVGLLLFSAIKTGLGPRIAASFQSFHTWHFVAMALVAALGSMIFFESVFPAVIVLFVLFALAWLRQFAFLMQLDDNAFPGRFDKPIWAFLMIVVPPVGLLTFWSYREAHWPRAKVAHLGEMHDLA